MQKNSILQLLGSVAGPMSLYLNAAAVSTDPLERMKHIITANFSYIYPCHCWEKPLNPILGETYQADLADGTKICLEQVCHKPPVSYITIDGPESLF